MDLLETKGGFTIQSSIINNLRNDFSSGSLSNIQTIQTINHYYRSKKILLCPHSAIGVKVAEESLKPEESIISLATANPGKFKDTVEEAISESIQLPEKLIQLIDKKEIYKVVPPDINLIASEIRNYFNH